MSVNSLNLDLNRRNFGLYNEKVREILYFVGISEQKVSIGEIANEIRNINIKKMSNEYKIIKRLYFDFNQFLIYDRPITESYLHYSENKYKNKNEKLFFLSFRGLMLYLYNEHLVLKKEVNINYEKKTDRDKIHFRRTHVIVDNSQYNKRIYKRIRKVLSNTSTKTIAPFLNYYEDFERFGFKAVNIFLEISIELQNQLHITYDKDSYLLKRASERYFIELENYYNVFIKQLSPYHKHLGINEYLSIEDKMNYYRKTMIDFEKDTIAKKENKIKELYKKCHEFEFFKELDDLTKLNPIFIDVKKMLKNHKLYHVEDLSKIINLKYNDKYELIKHCFLINRTESRRITKKIYYEHYDNLSNLLKDIPQIHRATLIRVLGFKIKDNLIVPKNLVKL